MGRPGDVVTGAGCLPERGGKVNGHGGHGCPISRWRRAVQATSRKPGGRDPGAARAAAIASRAEGPTRVLVEVNVAEEPTKGGIVPPQLRAFVDDVSVHPDLVIGGLMAMPPYHSDAQMSRPHFAALRRLADDLAGEWEGRHDFRDLSMGTSQDFLVAAEEGATMVRVGRGLLERVQTTTQGLA